MLLRYNQRRNESFGKIIALKNAVKKDDMGVASVGAPTCASPMSLPYIQDSRNPRRQIGRFATTTGLFQQ
jgi:hypothetical protein